MFETFFKNNRPKSIIKFLAVAWILVGCLSIINTSIASPAYSGDSWDSWGWDSWGGNDTSSSNSWDSVSTWTWEEPAYSDCTASSLNETSCGDGVDNDCDGVVDGADPDCGNQQTATFEICDNGADDDFDWAVDCSDSDCVNTSYCQNISGSSQTAGYEVYCSNGYDDDGDYLIDCSDSDCSAHCSVGPGMGGYGAVSSCTGYSYCDQTCPEYNECSCNPYSCGYVDPSLIQPEECSNGSDDDYDGQTDCADSDCSYSFFSLSTWACRSAVEICENNIDDDANGDTDCSDAACSGSASCSVCTPTTEVCGDGVDNDCDGAVDCSDGDCAFTVWAPSTWTCSDPEICDNGMDDDNDGDADCSDTECSGSSSCRPDVCTSNPNNVCDASCPQYNAQQCELKQCTGTSYCNTACPAFNACLCNPDSQECQETGGGGTTKTENCSNGSDDDGDGRADCADSDCSAVPACKQEICSNGIDDNENGQTDCYDEACMFDSSCRVIEEYCNDSEACNYGANEVCRYEDPCPTAAIRGCMDKSATNYNQDATEEGDCHYLGEYDCNANFDVLAADMPYLALALNIKNLFAGNPGDIVSADFFIRISLNRDKRGNWALTLSSQVAATARDGTQPLGAIQFGPTASFSGGAVVPTQPGWADDVMQARMHEAIRGGTFMQWFRSIHARAEQTCDAFNWKKRPKNR